MKKFFFALVMVAVFAAGSVNAQPRGYYGGRGMVHHPRYERMHHHHHGGDFGSFLIGAAVGALVDHIITEAVAEPVERTVVVGRKVAPVERYEDDYEDTDRYNRSSRYDDAAYEDGFYENATTVRGNGSKAPIIVERAPGQEVIIVERPGFSLEIPRRK